MPGGGALNQGLEIELKNGAREVKVVLVLAQHIRMHHTEATDFRPRATAHRKPNRGPAAGEKGPAKLLVLAGSDRVARLARRRIGELAPRRGHPRDLVEGHDAIQKAVDQLKARRQARVSRHEMALVSCPDIGRVVLEHHIAHLEELDAVLLGHGFVVVERLESPRQQTSSNHLVFFVRRVQQLHRRAVIRPPQVVEVFLGHAQAVREHLCVPSASHLVTKLIAEVIDGQRPADRERVRRLAGHEFIETVSDGNVLYDVNRVQDIASSGRHGHGNRGFGRRVRGGPELHPRAQLANGLRQYLHANDRGDVPHRGFGLASAQPRRGLVANEHALFLRTAEVAHALAPLFVYHVNGLHGKLIGAVLAEHSHDGVKHDVGFGQVSGCALDKHVSRLERDSRVAPVDDGGKRHDALFTVPNDRVQGRVLNEGHVGREVFAGRVCRVVLEKIASCELQAIFS
mmetsp:Transcript_37783/g.84419  ORF Transcript_37783/g.84419 Transcript_37783/m.84419 type:complete len:457 (-) Transcript_37783:630-2000(-)